MSSLVVSKGYASGASQDGVPASLLSNQLAKPIKSIVTQLRAVQSQVGSASASSSVTFQLPFGPGAGYLKGGSVYISGKNVTTQGATAVSFSYGGTAGSCAQLFSNLSVACGGCQVENITEFGRLQNLIETHCTNTSYNEKDMLISGEVVAAATALGTSYFQLPIISGFFNSSQAIPLFLLSSPLTVTLTTTTDALAIGVDAGTATYALSNLRMHYEHVSVDSEMETGLKQSLLSGAMYEIPFASWTNAVTSSSQTMNYSMGLGLSSVLGAFVTETTAALSAATALKTCSDAGVISDFRLYVDGRLNNAYAIDTTGKKYNEMQRACGTMADSTITSAATLSSYTASQFWAGQSLRKVSDGDLVMSGSAVQNLVFNLEHTNSVASTVLFSVLWTGVALIDGTGSIVVAK